METMTPGRRSEETCSPYSSAKRRSFSPPPVGRTATNASSPFSIARAISSAASRVRPAWPGIASAGRRTAAPPSDRRAPPGRTGAPPRRGPAGSFRESARDLPGRTGRGPGPGPPRAAPRKTGDLLLDRRRLDHHEHGAGGVVEPPGRHRRNGRREHDPLDLGGKPAEPLRQKRPFLLRLPRGRERREHDGREPFFRALRVGVEDADRRDAVAVELDAHGELAVRREDVEEAAPHGEVAGLDDEIAAPVPDGRQAGHDLRERDLLARDELQPELRKILRRGQPREERAGGDDDRLDGLVGLQGAQQPELVAAGLQRRAGSAGTESASARARGRRASGRPQRGLRAGPPPPSRPARRPRPERRGRAPRRRG